MSCKERVTKQKIHPPISFGLNFMVRKYFWNHFIEHILSSTSRPLLFDVFFLSWFRVGWRYTLFVFFLHLSTNSKCMYGMRKWMLSVQHTCSISFFYHQMETHIFICRASKLTDSWHFSSKFSFHLFLLSDELMCLRMPVLSKCASINVCSFMFSTFLLPFSSKEILFICNWRLTLNGSEAMNCHNLKCFNFISHSIT